MHGSGKFRLLTLAVIALLPSVMKRAAYRAFFGYRIGKRVRIGLTIVDVGKCEIQDDVCIGHLNIFTRIKELSIADHARVGHLNVFRGGDEVKLGRYSEVIRLNEINSIPDPEVVNPVEPRFLLVGIGV